MQKFLWVLIFLIFGFSILFIVFFTLKRDDHYAYRVVNYDQKNVAASTSEVEVVPVKEGSVIPKSSLKMIGVPYVSEAPEGNWSGDWVNACEEATIAMVEAFYNNKSSVSIAEAKKTLQKLFDEQNILYGNNKNADATQIQELITRYSNFTATIKENPTLNDIKHEIDNNRPVISLHRGFDLRNPNIPFSPIKSSYHTIVVVGYDDDNKLFITHDPGDDKDGVHHKYSYEVFMHSLHNYNAKDDKTDGVPTAIFTRSK